MSKMIHIEDLISFRIQDFIYLAIVDGETKLYLVGRTMTYKADTFEKIKRFIVGEGMIESGQLVFSIRHVADVTASEDLSKNMCFIHFYNGSPSAFISAKCKGMRDIQQELAKARDEPVITKAEWDGGFYFGPDHSVKEAEKSEERKTGWMPINGENADASKTE